MTATAEQNLEELTVPELKEMADELDVQVPSHATKDEIIKAIEKKQKPGSSNANAGGAKKAEEDPKKAAKANFAMHTEDELRSKAEEEGVDVPEGATHAELSAALVEADVEPFALTNTVPAGDMIADVYGIGMKFNITLADLIGLGAFTTGTLVLPIPGGGLPPGAIIQLIRLKHTQAVAGAGPITAATAGVATANNTYTPFNIFQAVGDTVLQTLQLTSGNVENFAAVTPVNIAIALTGGNASGLTAGAFSVWLRYALIA